MGTKVKLFLGLLLVGVVVVAGVYAMTVWELLPSRELSPAEKILLQQRQQDQVAEIVKTNDPAKCEQAKDIVIDGRSYQEVCENNIYMNLAQEKLDTSYCKKLDDKSYPIELCMQSVLSQKAATATSPDFCNAVEGADLKEGCLYQYWLANAMRKGDTAVCNSISNPIGVSYCKDTVYTKNLAGGAKLDCTLFSKEKAADCKSVESAIQSKSATSCALVQDVDLQQVCSSRIQ